MSVFDQIFEQFTGVKEVTLSLDGIIFDFRCNYTIGQFGIVNTLIPGFDVGTKIFANKAVEKRAQYVLLKIPAVYRARTSLAIAQIWRCRAARCCALVMILFSFSFVYVCYYS